MKLSKQGNELIKSFEGLRLKAYRCDGGKWTIGWGHTGPEVKKGLVWTRQQADDAFDKDTDRFESAVTALAWSSLEGASDGCRATLTGQFDALVSLAFNIGTGEEGFAGSTLLKRLRASDIIGAAEQFTRWNKAGGKFNPGLLARRTKEMRIFLCGH